jgi:hypothetical protein
VPLCLFICVFVVGEQQGRQPLHTYRPQNITKIETEIEIEIKIKIKALTFIFSG